MQAEELKPLQNVEDGKSSIRIVVETSKPNQIPIGDQTRAVRRQEFMVLLGNIGILSSGMGLGLPSVIINQLRDPTEIVHFDDSQTTWLASINTLSCPLGGLLSGYLLDKLGRKKTLYVLNIISLFAWVLMAAAIQHDTRTVYIQLLISRFLIGISMGLSSAPVGVYSAEISTPKTRSRLILGTSISIALGIMVIYTLGYFIRDDWHMIALICCGYQIISLLCVVPMNESPSWLLSKKQYDEAKKSLNYFRGLDKSCDISHPEVICEYNTLQKSIQLSAEERKESFLKLLRFPEVYKPLFILMVLFAFQQITGIFVVVVYAVQIANEAGVTIDPLLCAIYIGIARVLTTIPMSYILEKWGRRLSGMISAFGMSMCMFLLAGQNWISWFKNIPYLPVVAIVAFIVLSTIGLYTLPFIMISELFPQKVRGPASGLTVAFGMLVAFICLKTYPGMKSIVGNSYCFMIYGLCALAAVIFIYFFLPETKGCTLLQIEEKFHKSKKYEPHIASCLNQEKAFVE